MPTASAVHVKVVLAPPLNFSRAGQGIGNAQAVGVRNQCLVVTVLATTLGAPLSAIQQLGVVCDLHNGFY